MSSFVAPVLEEDEEQLDVSLRPRRLDEFVGQERVKEQLEIALTAAKARGEPLDHVLLAGPPGLGKTSLAYIVREELGVGIRTVAGPALERKGDLAAILTALETRDAPSVPSRPVPPDLARNVTEIEVAGGSSPADARARMNETAAIREQAEEEPQPILPPITPAEFQRYLDAMIDALDEISGRAEPAMAAA